jgi:uncharacterized paraquat-inducible protein A
MKTPPAAATKTPPATATKVKAGPVTCPSCRTANDADARFCKKCGAKLGERR